MSVAPAISIVSLCRNRRERVAELLAALAEQDYRPRPEVILVDNGSEDGTLDMVQQQFPTVQIIETGSNQSMVAYNHGFAAAHGDIILVLDDDGLPDRRDWISRMAAAFAANPRLGAACCTIRMRDTGRLAHDSPQFCPRSDGRPGFPSPAYNGTGAGLRRLALQQVGLYPWHFGIMFLELHLCTRLIDAGWEVRHFPDIEAWHSRPTGSSDPPLSPFGLRNYFWYVWELYPGMHAPVETLHMAGFYLKLALLGKLPLRRVIRALAEAVAGARSSLRTRSPVARTTLATLKALRRCGNDYGMAPQYRPFDPPRGKGSVQ